MAISDNYNSLTFGGVNSLDYGIYISGPGVYNAPTRAVEFVDVPGRNGAIEIDQGHWNNIEVTYEAGMFADDQADFGEKLNAFRNAIVSQVGYQRLTDTYNPEHYRLGVYASGIEVNPVQYNDAAEFTLVFNCKPQRYLLSGDNAMSVRLGDHVENDTLYAASPLLMITVREQSISVPTAKAIVTFNEPDPPTGGPYIQRYSVSLNCGSAGKQVIAENETWKNDSKSFRIDDDITVLCQDTDTFTVKGLVIRSQWSSPYDFSVSPIADYQFKSIVSSSTDPDYQLSNAISYSFGGRSSDLVTTMTFSDITFTKNTPKEFSIWVRATIGDPANCTVDLPMKVSASYSAGTSGNYVDIKLTYFEPTRVSGNAGYMEYITSDYDWLNKSLTEVSVNATKPWLGNPTYVDTEIGDVYKIEDGKRISLNKYATFEKFIGGDDGTVLMPGTDLPKLLPGRTFIRTSSAVKDYTFEMKPRWWEL